MKKIITLFSLLLISASLYAQTTNGNEWNWEFSKRTGATWTTVASRNGGGFANICSGTVYRFRIIYDGNLPTYYPSLCSPNNPVINIGFLGITKWGFNSSGSSISNPTIVQDPDVAEYVCTSPQNGPNNLKYWDVYVEYRGKNNAGVFASVLGQAWNACLYQDQNGSCWLGEVDGTGNNIYYIGGWEYYYTSGLNISHSFSTGFNPDNFVITRLNGAQNYSHDCAPSDVDYKVNFINGLVYDWDITNGWSENSPNNDNKVVVNNAGGALNATLKCFITKPATSSCPVQTHTETKQLTTITDFPNFSSWPWDGLRPAVANNFCNNGIPERYRLKPYPGTTWQDPSMDGFIHYEFEITSSPNDAARIGNSAVQNGQTFWSLYRDVWVDYNGEDEFELRCRAVYDCGNGEWTSRTFTTESPEPAPDVIITPIEADGLCAGDKVTLKRSGGVNSNLHWVIIQGATAVSSSTNDEEFRVKLSSGFVEAIIGVSKTGTCGLGPSTDYTIDTYHPNHIPDASFSWTGNPNHCDLVFTIDNPQNGFGYYWDFSINGGPTWYKPVPEGGVIGTTAILNPPTWNPPGNPNPTYTLYVNAHAQTCLTDQTDIVHDQISILRTGEYDCNDNSHDPWRKGAFSEDDPLGSELSIFPNPSAGSFSITSDSEIIQVSIISLKGEEIQTLFPGSKGVDVEIQKPGLYLAKIHSVDGTFAVEKIVVE